MQIIARFGKIRLNFWRREIFVLKDTAKSFEYLDISELLKFHFVFDEIPINSHYDDVFEAIKFEILLKFEHFERMFNFNSLYQIEIKKALMKFAKSDRKKIGITKILPRFKAKIVLDELIKAQFLKIEPSHEKPLKKTRKNEKLPRELRRYKISDKVKFKSNFARFWFRFIEPDITLLKNGKISVVLEKIKNDFENYASFGFEILSRELIAKYFNLPNSVVSSFWNKEIEIDIYARVENFCVVGECKYKNRKICKNVLNLLDFKCQKAEISPNFRVLFSYSGFSEELLNIKDPKLLLFDAKDFKVLLD